jgi:hypothetical protein
LDGINAQAFKSLQGRSWHGLGEQAMAFEPQADCQEEGDSIASHAAVPGTKQHT